MTRLLLPLLCLFFFALAHAQSGRVAYTCDDGSRIAAEFMTGGAGRPQATLFLEGRQITLPLVPAASGALYRDGDLRFHTKGPDALFEDGKSPTRRCTSGDAPHPAATAPAPNAPDSFVDITGSIAYLARIALPPDAVLIVRVQDTARADAPALMLAEQRIDPGGRQVPIPFKLTVDRDLIGKNAQITVAARIERKGKLLFISDSIHRAFSDGQQRQVDIKLVPVGAARTP
jgi:putative lipoprotein